MVDDCLDEDEVEGKVFEVVGRKKQVNKIQPGYVGGRCGWTAALQ